MSAGESGFSAGGLFEASVYPITLHKGAVLTLSGVLAASPSSLSSAWGLPPEVLAFQRRSRLRLLPQLELYPWPFLSCSFSPQHLALRSRLSVWPLTQR